MDALRIAAVNGHLEVVKWLMTNRHEAFELDAIMNRVASERHLAILNGYTNIAPRGARIMTIDQAAGKGHLDVAKWLHRNRREGCSSMAINRAARNDHIEVIEWLNLYSSERSTPVAIKLLLVRLSRLDTPPGSVSLLRMSSFQFKIRKSSVTTGGVGMATRAHAKIIKRMHIGSTGLKLEFMHLVTNK
ncbi:putative ankyrin repeat domain-containing protein [Phytophthora infestans]|uniref:Putative ankyrin repeat domain-containing protein n=1 Tax=Phytophthora infestans TaxID=4787 RepID=A0A8S9UIR3_PHYIN|nr:putative ankyrin repeat domain-containing protein [Phytophthora infestans]